MTTQGRLGAVTDVVSELCGCRRRQYWPQVDGAHQEGGFLRTDGWPPFHTIRADSRTFTIEGLEFVNPISKYPTGAVARLVVMREVRADWRGRAVLPISPGLFETGQYQNIADCVVNDALIEGLL